MKKEKKKAKKNSLTNLVSYCTVQPSTLRNCFKKDFPSYFFFQIGADDGMYFTS